jgi:hypothetical protein
MNEELIKELNKIIPCSCIDAYKFRKLSAPDCANCIYAKDILDFIVAREKKIIEEYKAIYFCDCDNPVPDMRMERG